MTIIHTDQDRGFFFCLFVLKYGMILILVSLMNELVG